MAHYAEAFYVPPGQYFRFAHDGIGPAMPYPEPVSRGRFTDRTGKRWQVEAWRESGGAQRVDLTKSADLLPTRLISGGLGHPRHPVGTAPRYWWINGVSSVFQPS